MDSGKNDGGSGDLIIWNTLLALAEERHVNIAFVSNETKEDWYYKSRNRTGTPTFQLRLDLVDEFRRKTSGRTIRILSFSAFLAAIKADQEVQRQVLHAEQVKRDDDAEFFRLETSMAIFGLHVHLQVEGPKRKQLEDGLATILANYRERRANWESRLGRSEEETQLGRLDFDSQLAFIAEYEKEVAQHRAAFDLDRIASDLAAISAWGRGGPAPSRRPQNFTEETFQRMKSIRP